ncbi:hypothetical protein Tco_1388320, partial [Tanacetum coccineum]
MAPLPLREQRHPFLMYQGLEYSDKDIADFKERLGRIHDRGTHRVQVLDLRICPEFRDTWAWVTAGPARQEGDAGGVAKEALVAPGGGDEEMPQAVPPPPRTQDSMAHDLSRFTAWTITNLSQLMDRADVPYTRYSESPVEYQRRTRQRVDDANTSTAP